MLTSTMPSSTMLTVQIYVDAHDLHSSEALHEHILYYLLRSHIKGASVFKGIAGFGKARRVHHPTALASTDPAPVLITFTDTEEQVRKVLPHLKELVEGETIFIMHSELA